MHYGVIIIIIIIFKITFHHLWHVEVLILEREKGMSDLSKDGKFCYRECTLAQINIESGMYIVLSIY